MTTIDSAAIKAVADAIWLNLCGDIRQTDADKRVYLDTAEAAIAAYLAALPSPKVEGEPVRMEWRLRGGTFPPREDAWSIVDYHTGLKIAEHPEKYETRPLYASPSPVLADEGVAGWQPISGAPKDGREILLYAHLPPVFEHYTVIGTYAADVGSRHLHGWEADGEFFPQDHDEQFTHWQPLPTPPALTP